MTATDASDPLHSTAKRTVLLHCKNEVLTAGRVESAVLSQPGADGHLVGTDQQNQDCSRGGWYSLDQLSQSPRQEICVSRG